MKLYTIIGFGTLLSKKSAQRTCPELSNFRRAVLNDYVRIFNKIDPNSPRDEKTYIANWSLMKRAGAKTLVTVFDIPASNYPDLLRRECEYEMKKLTFLEEETGLEGSGLGCCGFSSQDDFEIFIKKNPMQWRYLQDRQDDRIKHIWRNDLLPWPDYLSFCLKAAEEQGREYVDNMLDYSYLGDGVTSLRRYLS